MPMAQQRMPQRPPPYQSPALGPNFRPPPPAMPPGGGGGVMTANLQPPGAWAGGSGPGYFQPPPNSRPMPETGFGGFNPQMRPGQAYNPGGPNDMPVDMGWGAADNGPPIPPGAMPGPNTFLKGAPDIMSTG